MTNHQRMKMKSDDDAFVSSFRSSQPATIFSSFSPRCASSFVYCLSHCCRHLHRPASCSRYAWLMIYYDYDDGASPSCHCPSLIAYSHDLLSSGIVTVSDDVSLPLSLSHHPKDRVDDDDGGADLDLDPDRYGNGGARMRDMVLRRRDEQDVAPLVLYPPLFDVAEG